MLNINKIIKYCSAVIFLHIKLIKSLIFKILINKNFGYMELYQVQSAKHLVEFHVTKIFMDFITLFLKNYSFFTNIFRFFIKY